MQPPNAAGPDEIPADAALAGAPGALFQRRVSARRIKAEHVRDYGIVVFVIGLFVYFSIASPVFLTSGNLLLLVYQNAVVGIPACAVTLTVIAGNFDLSLGAIFTLAEVACAWAAVHWGVWWCFPVAIVAGAAMGLVNGTDHHEAARQRLPRDARDGARVHRARARRQRRPGDHPARAACSPSSARKRSGASSTRT